MADAWLALLPALVGSTLAAAPTDEAPPAHEATTATATTAAAAAARVEEQGEEERVYLVDHATGALLLKSTAGQGGLRWALPSAALQRRPPPEPAPAAAAPVSSSSSSTIRTAVVLEKGDGRGRRTIIRGAENEEEEGELVSIIAPGSVLLEAPAVAAVVAAESLERVCHRCLRPPARGARILECDACRTAHWCSHACFAEDDDKGKGGGVHALLCPRLRRVRQRGLLKGTTGAAALALEGDTIRLTMQILAISMLAFQRRVAAYIKANGGPVTSREELPPGMQRELEEVSDLVSHRAEASPELWREAMAVANGLRAPEAKEKGGEKDERAVRSDALFCTWPAEELAELLLRVRLNSHPLTIPAVAAAAGQQQQRVRILGLFPRLAGTVNHACRPTAALSCHLVPSSLLEEGQEHWGQRLRAQLRALEPLGPGEEVTYSYLAQVHTPRSDRQQQLLQTFYFHCRCGRCQEERTSSSATGGDDALACPRCGGPASRPTADTARCLGECGGGGEEATMPGSSFDRAVTEGQALLARARGAAGVATGAVGGRGGGGDRRVWGCAEELLAWLTGSGSGVRRLGQEHKLRSEGATLLLSLAQQAKSQQHQSSLSSPPTPSPAIAAAVAIAAAAGVMDAFFLAKRLDNHPQRAVMLLARARALAALAASVSVEGSAVLWALARQAARGAVGVCRVAMGEGDVLTVGARASMAKIEAEQGV